MEIKGNITRFLEPNTDTDVIIPAKFLKRTALDGFEKFAFFEKRYSPETQCDPSLEAKDYVFNEIKLNPDCMLNHPNCDGATFLLTWQNFGCGSSREHAVYALKNYKVIIGSAPSGKSAFADIFRDNCRQNLIWTPVLSESDFKEFSNYLVSALEKSAVEIVLDSEKQILKSSDEQVSFEFDLPNNHKDYLLAGMDAFDKAKLEINKNLDHISRWEKAQSSLLQNSPNSKVAS